MRPLVQDLLAYRRARCHVRLLPDKTKVNHVTDWIDRIPLKATRGLPRGNPFVPSGGYRPVPGLPRVVREDWSMHQGPDRCTPNAFSGRTEGFDKGE